MMKSILLVFLFLWAPSTLAQEAVDHTHAHNDYVHPRPLLDALEYGFVSIEADIHLVDGALLVAHDLEDVEAGRALERLYLEPLRDRIRRHGGQVYVDGPPLLLLVDVKSEANSTYDVLHDVLRSYADILTIYSGEGVVSGPVQVVISGNRARDAMKEQAIRFAAYDGRPDDLTEYPDASPNFIPLISAPWYGLSSWRGDGPLPPKDRAALNEIVEQAHKQGRILRFWATPDKPIVWDALMAAGVDLIGADDLGALRAYLRSRAD